MKSSIISKLVALSGIWISSLPVSAFPQPLGPSGSHPPHGPPSLPHDLSSLVGQHVIYSWSGLTPPDHLYDLTAAGKVGGIILFKANINGSTPAMIAKFQSLYRQSPSYLGVPLFITTDQEGGLVRRVPGGPGLSAKQVGASTDPVQAATQAGKEAHDALAPYNINSNLAPVVDIYREEGDFIDQFQRSYGNTSRLVAECATAYLVTQQKLGLITTAKHFPGLGAVDRGVNTDLEPVTINLPLKEIRAIDEVPYIAAIAAGVKTIMASWAIYPSLDSKYPSGLSKKWVKDELRGRLRYKGVTITDAIEAGALAAFGDMGERAVLAKVAGMDLILASAQNATQGEVVVGAIEKALKGGRINKKEFEDATNRIVNLRRGLN